MIVFQHCLQKKLKVTNQCSLANLQFNQISATIINKYLSRSKTSHNQQIIPFHHPMRPQSQPLAILKNREKIWLKQFPKIQVITNQYETRLNNNFKYFRVFQIHSQPQVQTDSHQIYRQAMKQLPQTIKKSLQCTYFAKRGYTIWYLTRQELTKEQETLFKATPPKYMIKVNQFEYMITLKLVKQAHITDKESIALVAQFLNIKFKQMIVQNCKMKELTNNVFFPQWSSYFYDEKFQIEARIGFQFKLGFLEIQLFCDVNNRVKQMNKKSFLEVLREKRYGLGHYIGLKIRKMYGNFESYEIEDIDTNMTPKSTFDKKGQKITYADYFKRSYGRSVYEMDQPLILVSSRLQMRFKREGKKSSDFSQKIYLIPQLVSMTQISQAAKKATQKELQLSPNECIHTANKFISEVNSNKNEFTIIAQNRVGYAHLLPEPYIQLNQLTTLQPNDGMFRVDTEVYETLRLQDVLIVYSVGKDKKYDRRQIDECVKTLNFGGDRYKIRIPEEPCCLEIDQQCGPERWIAQVEKDMKENSKPNLILFALMDKQQQFYPYLKEQLTYRLEIESQMFLRSKISNQKKGSAKIAGNIMKQIAAKKNKTLWKIKGIPGFEDKLALIVGISIQKLGQGFQLIISRSINKEVSTFKTKTFMLQSKEIPLEVLEQQFYASLQDYIKYQKKKYKPTTIIVYRMGLNNEKYAQGHLQTQSKVLKQRIEHICKSKFKKEIYEPQLIYIQVHDRPSQKLWIQVEGHQHGSFLPKAVNPQVGTVMRGAEDEEFYLVAYQAKFGTVQPALYKVFMNEKKLPMEFITQFTLAQSYMYYNWEGSVRLPQILQLCKKAHKYVKPKGEYKNHVFESTGFI